MPPPSTQHTMKTLSVLASWTHAPFFTVSLLVVSMYNALHILKTYFWFTLYLAISQTAVFQELELLWMKLSLPTWNGNLNSYGIEFIPLIQSHNLFSRAKGSQFFLLVLCISAQNFCSGELSSYTPKYWNLSQCRQHSLVFKTRHHF